MIISVCKIKESFNLARFYIWFAHKIKLQILFHFSGAFLFGQKKRQLSATTKKLTANHRLIFHVFDAVYWARVSFLWWPWCSKSRSFVVCLISRGQPTIYPHPPLCPALPIKDVSSEVYLPAKVDMWSHVVREHMCLSSTLWSQAWQLRSCCQN